MRTKIQLDKLVLILDSATDRARLARSRWTRRKCDSAGAFATKILIKSPQIEDDRLEVLWPIYKIKLKPPKPGDPQIEKIVCPEFTSKKNAQDNHGNMVANLAAGTSYGLAPNAKVVLVNRIPASDVPGSQGGIGLAYCAILEHYQTLPIGTRAILSISAGSAAASIEYSIDSFKRVDDLIEAGIIIVAAAGNRAENQLVCTYRISIDWHFVTDLT